MVYNTISTNCTKFRKETKIHKIPNHFEAGKPYLVAGQP
jgi:hypothetical protein